VVGDPRVLALVGLMFGGIVPGCGAAPADEPVEEGPTEDEPAATVSPEPAADPAHPRWPRSIPPELYRAEEVDSPAVVRGTVLAATEGRGIHFAVEDSELCTEELLPETFPPGPLAGVVVWLEGVTAGEPLQERDVDLRVGGCDLSPRVQLAPLGSNVSFTSTDGAEHVARSILWDGYRDLGSVTVPADGSSVQRKLRVPGLVHLRCEAHPAARAWIWVQPHPYHALTGPEGTYRIGKIPPGRYVLHAWHEGFAEQTLQVDVPPSGELQLDLVF